MSKFFSIQVRPSQFVPITGQTLTHYKRLSTDEFEPFEPNKTYMLKYYLVTGEQFVTRVAGIPFVFPEPLRVTYVDLSLFAKLVVGGTIPGIILRFANLTYNKPEFNHVVLTCTLLLRFFNSSDVNDLVDVVPPRFYTILKRDLQSVPKIGYLQVYPQAVGKYGQFALVFTHTIFGTVYSVTSERFQVPTTFTTEDVQIPMLTTTEI